MDSKIASIRVWLRDVCDTCKGLGYIPISTSGSTYDYQCDNDDCKDGYVETSKKLELDEFSRMLKNNE